MTHLYFVLYGLSLLSGFMLIGALISNDDVRQSRGFSSFLQMYLTVSGFVLLATAYLYVKANLAGGQATDLVFTCSIPIFLTILTLLIIRHESVVLGVPIFTRLKPWLIVGVIIGIALSILIWRLPSKYTLTSILICIAFLIVMLIVNQVLLRSFKPITSKKSRRTSIFMTVQSLALPLVELIVWRDKLDLTGMSLSMPLVYLINNGLLWYFRKDFFLVDKEKKTIGNNDIYIPDILTSKEKQVVHAVVKGLSNKEIAHLMHISPSTVKNHLYTIYKKLNITNRVALMASVMRGDS